MSRMFAGLCVGGPLDGRRVQHYGPRYRAAIQKGAPISFSAVEASMALDIACFEYRHVEHFDTGFWLPDEVFTSCRFEHKRFDNPIQFLLRTLAAGYNPEGY